MKKEAIVIGGGLAGLSAAIHLAARGASVRLIEQNPTLGGKLSTYSEKGYYWDIGPSVVSLPFYLALPFEAAGHRMEEFLTLEPLEPITHYYFDDGKKLSLWKDLGRMREELRAWGEEAFARWQAYLEYARKLYERAAPLFLEVPLHELRLLLRHPALRKLHNLWLPIDPFRTMHQAAQSLLRIPHLVQIADRYATYNGSNPYQAPATFHLIAWVENGLGIYHIRGGVYELVKALKKLAQRVGVQLHLGEAAKTISVRQDKVVGVETTAATYAAEAVISAVDIRTTYEVLLRRELPWLYRQSTPSLSGLVFLWGIQGESPFGYHNILFSADYAKENFELWRQRRPPSDPTVYICITSRLEAAHAPPRGENWFILLNMPPLVEPWTEAEVQRLRTAVIRRVQHVWPGFSDHLIEVEAVRTPVDWARLGSASGSLYGSASNSWLSAFLRPPNRSRRIRGLYFAGGSVHPGGGMPLAILSGRHAATLAAEALGLLKQNRP